MPNSTFDLSGKSVLVTGDNSGIGLGMAEAVAEAGASVCIWSRNKERNLAALEGLVKYGNNAFALECDVSKEDQVTECFYKTVDLLGDIDSFIKRFV